VQLGFGSGALWGERTDKAGSGIGPQQFGVLQDVQIDWDYTTKPLWGQLQFPVAIARGQGKITGKARFARILGSLYSDIYWGLDTAVGQFAVSELEPTTVPAVSTYTITVTNAAHFNDDLGVYYAATGLPFTRVTTATTAGQYAVNPTTGVYTFSSADANAPVLISYTWNNTTTGKLITLTNQYTGTTPTFKATFYQPITPGTPGAGGDVVPTALRLNVCVSSKLTMPTKVDDWQIYELDFEAYAPASGIIGYFSTVE